MGKRIGIYLCGLSITALGIALIILSQAGAGPWDIVAVGLNLHFGLTIGMWSIIAQAVVVLITAVIDRSKPQVGSVIAIIIRSWFLDLWIYIVFRGADFSTSWEIQWLSLVCGLMAAGLGIGIYVEARLPKTPIDGLMVAVHERYGLSLNVSRTIIESVAVIIGYFLGGPVGIGTLIIAVLLGRVIQLSNRSIKKAFYNKRMTLT